MPLMELYSKAYTSDKTIYIRPTTPVEKISPNELPSPRGDGRFNFCYFLVLGGFDEDGNPTKNVYLLPNYKPTEEDLSPRVKRTVKKKTKEGMEDSVLRDLEYMSKRKLVT
jgi:hypothetical protein